MNMAPGQETQLLGRLVKKFKKFKKKKKSVASGKGL